METYHKIQTVFKRDPETNYKTLLIGQYSIPEFEYLADNRWDFTEKIDGMNIRIIWDGERVSFNGKTDNAQLPGNLVNKLNGKIEFLEDKFRTHFSDKPVCLYGEGYGAGIQKGGCYREDQDFVLFDVKMESWFGRGYIEDIAHDFEMDIVPMVGWGPLSDMIDIVKNGFISRWGDFMAEGIVARPSQELLCRNGNRIITKLKYRDFPRN